MTTKQGNAIMVMLMVLIVCIVGFMVEVLFPGMDTPRRIFYVLLVCGAGGMLFHAWGRES